MHRRVVVTWPVIDEIVRSGVARTRAIEVGTASWIEAIPSPGRIDPLLAAELAGRGAWHRRERSPRRRRAAACATGVDRRAPRPPHRHPGIWPHCEGHSRHPCRGQAGRLVAKHPAPPGKDRPARLFSVGPPDRKRMQSASEYSPLLRPGTPTCSSGARPRAPRSMCSLTRALHGAGGKTRRSLDRAPIRKGRPEPGQPAGVPAQPEKEPPPDAYG